MVQVYFLNMLYDCSYDDELEVFDRELLCLGYSISIVLVYVNGGRVFNEVSSLDYMMLCRIWIFVVCIGSLNFALFLMLAMILFFVRIYLS
jgi:hypothetical protein